MKVFEIINIVQILTGAVIMLSSILLGLKIKKTVSNELSRKWFIVIFLMGFFLLGYLLSVLILLFKISFSFEMITAAVFLGGSCFVYIIMKLSRSSIESFMKTDRELQRTLLELAELREVDEDRLAELNLVNHKLLNEIDKLKA